MASKIDEILAESREQDNPLAKDPNKQAKAALLADMLELVDEILDICDKAIDLGEGVSIDYYLKDVSSSKAELRDKLKEYFNGKDN